MNPTIGDFLPSALISPCGRYRYYLTRTWAAGLARMVFVMLNPSTADAENDDQTIRKCLGFAQRAGCGSLAVVNLFAFRATDPADLRAAHYPVGPENDFWLLSACSAAEMVVYAWGANASGHAVARRAREVQALLAPYVKRPLCIAKTKDGHPQHPCMAAYGPLVSY